MKWAAASIGSSGPSSDQAYRGEAMTVQGESSAKTHGVILTEAAAAKAKSLLDQEGRDDLTLRIAVQPGGCAGLRYNLFFDDRTLDGDLTAEFGGVTLTVDRMSAPYLEGASIDFVDTIEKQGFTIDNPNATGSCACGDSFN
jgi:iron-sulfur cluster assembly accessory protein